MGLGFSWEELPNWGLRIFDTLWLALDANPMSQNLGSKFFGNSRVYRTLDWPSSMSGTNVMAQNPILPQNQKNALSLPLAPFRYSPLEHASELFEPSKDSWRLVVCTEKYFWDLDSGFSVGVVRKRVGLAFLVLLWRHHPDNGPKLWLKIWLYSRLEYEAVEA